MKEASVGEAILGFPISPRICVSGPGGPETFFFCEEIAPVRGRIEAQSERAGTFIKLPRTPRWLRSIGRDYARRQGIPVY